MTRTIRIGDREVGPGAPVFIIAELSANHHGDLERAKRLIRIAGEAGADAVKLQTYTADSMTIDSDAPAFVVGEGSIWAGRRLYELYQEAATPYEWYGELRDHAADLGLQLFSTPFDPDAVRFLEQFEPPAYKIASFELVDIPLIRSAASTGRPLIMSTGMATADEIELAVSTATESGDGGVVLLHCNSGYPASPAEMDLRTIADMAERWGFPVGLSDHTLSDTAAIASVALGTCALEKHFTEKRSDGGPDSQFSLEPDELARLVASVREAEAALGGVRYGPSERERPSLAFRRSLWFVEDVEVDQVITHDHVRAIRPAGGMAPGRIDEVVGRRTRVAVSRATPVTDDVIGQ